MIEQERPSAKLPRFPIVGIGASAGGLEAIESFFKPIPADIGMAFVIIQHLSPDHKSLLPELVARFTRLSVHEVTDGMAAKPNHIYIIPPNHGLGLLHGCLHLMEPEEPRGHRHPIDIFFRSLALEQKDNAICVVLSGTGSEGTLGLAAIKENGGIVFVQDPDTAAYDGMPRSALATGLADFVLAPQDMAQALLTFARDGAKDGPERKTGKPPGKESVAAADLLTIFGLLRQNTGYDFSFYKKNTIIRRINKRMMYHGIDNFTDYIRFLQKDPGEVKSLFGELLIRVTNFFRDKNGFAVLREIAIPAMFKGRAPNDAVRVWVPGCSTGEEAYSIAILLREYMDRNGLDTPVQVFATDIDGKAINTARRGIFPASIGTDLPPDLLKSYFIVGDGGYQVKKSIRDLLVFAVQSVSGDAPFSRLDLISCRNLLIYMGPVLQNNLLAVFHYALKPDAFLFLGSSESIGAATDLFKIVDRKWKLFQRLPGPRCGPRTFNFTPAPRHPPQLPVWRPLRKGGRPTCKPASGSTRNGHCCVNSPRPPSSSTAGSMSSTFMDERESTWNPPAATPA
ncbi:MAG: hypothetical protein HQL37_07055 [Alphaproteobacteria bacterium]|nr:hypothetical protein [Alphaproteobacteria bacterium]